MTAEIVFSRVWAMPNHDTLDIGPIGDLSRRWVAMSAAKMIIDPFARNSNIGSHTNDLNPQTGAMFHLDAVEFIDKMIGQHGQESFDMAILDPPYSPRQIAECYSMVGRKVGMEETQTARLYKECKDRLARLLRPSGIAITIGWSSVGFGINRGFTIREIMLVCCGGAHNDYIVTVEQKDDGLIRQPEMMLEGANP